MSVNWISLLGEFEEHDEALLFKGGVAPPLPGYEQETVNVGNFLSDQPFGGGAISADIRFLESVEKQACEFILFYHSQARAFLTAGIGVNSLGVVRAFAAIGTGLSTVYSQAGPHEQLKPNRDYKLEVSARGSRVSVAVDGVEVLVHVLPYVVPRGNPGLWCFGRNDILISHFTVSAEEPTAFVVMEFSPPFNEIYQEVIRTTCDQCGLVPHRADETFGPGLIIADIERRIADARLVIAEVTPANQNVFYELGYAHALGKPTILLAQAGTKLPFDVSPFRTLFYENSIAGKRRLEERLAKHIEAIQTEWAAV